MNNIPLCDQNYLGVPSSIEVTRNIAGFVVVDKAAKNSGTADAVPVATGYLLWPCGTKDLFFN